MAGHYRQLIAWQKSIDYVDAIYNASNSFPDDERFGLTSQIRRAVVSIASNIAEGQAHFHTREFIRFLRHSRGSLAELETQILIAKGLKYLPESQAEQLLNDAAEVSRILSGLISSLAAKS